MKLLPSTKNAILHYLKNMPINDFIKLHTSNFHNHYLSKPDYDTINECLLLPKDTTDYCFMYEELELCDIILDRYNDFFSNMTLEEFNVWLNDDDNKDLWLEIYQSTVDNSFNPSEEAYEIFNDYIYEIVSGWGIAWFLYEVLDELEIDMCSDDKVYEHWNLFSQSYVLNYLHLNKNQKRDLILERVFCK